MALALFKGYCYPTVTDAANAELSQPVYSGASGLFYMNSFSTITGSSVVFSSRYIAYSNGAITNSALTKTYPLCTDVGLQTDKMPITLPDATTLFFAIILTWAMAWSIKVLRRAL